MHEKSLAFLSYILRCTQEELQRTNAIIQAGSNGQRLPDGAEVVIAECLADPAAALLFSRIVEKRSHPHKYRHAVAHSRGTPETRTT